MLNKRVKFKKVIISLGIDIIAALIIILTLKNNVLGAVKDVKGSYNIAVVVKEDGLWALNLANPQQQVRLAKSGIYNDIIISPEGKWVAYTKDSELYTALIDFNPAKGQIIKVSEKILSYAWVDNFNLVYSVEIGGLKGFSLKTLKWTDYVKSKDLYEGLISNKEGILYGQKFISIIKNGEKTIEDKGIISYDIINRKERLMLPSIPISTEDLGFMPEAAGLSKDGSYVYVWRKVHAASVNTDGVGFGVIEVKNNKFITYDKVSLLTYKDNLAANPKKSNLLVLNSGIGREMNVNKALIILNIKSGASIPALPDNFTAYVGPDGITVRGMVTMTPAYSKDGRKIIFSAAMANEDMQQWHKEPHNIYSVDTVNKKIEKLTKGNTFDFAPSYILNDNAIVFVRKTDENHVSLWKIQNNKEECLCQGIKLGENSWFYGHYNLEDAIQLASS